VSRDPGSPSRLQDELRQTRPFRSRSQEAFLALLRTSDLAKHRFADLFDAEDITLQQYNVLRILRGAGEQGLPTLEIGERMIERTPGVTRIVDRLERKGWVSRDRGVHDRRRVWCSITDDGLALLARLDGPVDATDEAIFSGLDGEELDELLRVLEVLRTRMADLEADPG
jgi:DNA-binding MarR family transcriptional regulator